jgi:hypothetical protein
MHVLRNVVYKLLKGIEASIHMNAISVSDVLEIHASSSSGRDAQDERACGSKTSTQMQAMSPGSTRNIDTTRASETSPALYVSRKENLINKLIK